MNIFKPFREGMEAARTHGNFSMSPYGPSPRAYERPKYRTERTISAAAWARGFWFAKSRAAPSPAKTEGKK